jgi:hypothetical protein
LFAIGQPPSIGALVQKGRDVMLVFRFLVASCCCACLAEAESVEKMLAACKQVATSSSNVRITVLPQDFDSGLCWGAFGVLEQFVKALNGTKVPSQLGSGICVPDNTARSRLINAFVEFVKAHPDRGQQEFYPAARDALTAAFPCRAGAIPSK